MSETRSCRRCGAAIAPGAGIRGMCPKCLMELGLMELGLGSDPGVVVSGHGEPSPPPPEPEELAPLFPRFEIGELLGRGGMGVVYRARQKDLDREVALKILPDSAGRDPSFPERFAREARTLAALDHPNVVRVHDFGRAGEHYYLAMELVDGVTLRDLIRRRELAPRQALEVVMQVCDALQYAHDEGVVHRDVKPENVLVDRKGSVKIADFGLAKLVRGPVAGDALTRSGRIMGTPHYMAPEQIEHPLAVDHRADVYALGVLFYELLTGELPIGRFAPPSQRVQVDVRLDEVVMRALEREPERRYQRAGDVRTDVERISKGPAREAAAGAAADGGGADRRKRRGGGRRTLWVVLIAFGCLFLLVPCVLAPLFLGSVVEPTYEDVTGTISPPEAPLLEWSPDGEPALSARAAETLGPVPLDDLNVVLGDVRARYLEAEQEHAEVLATDDGVLVHVVPFPERRAELARDLRARLSDVLEVDRAQRLVAMGIAEALLPGGEAPNEIRIARDADGYLVVEERTDGPGAVHFASFEEMPPRLQAFWSRAYVPLRTSAAEAVAVVLGILDEARAAAPEDARISLDRIGALSAYAAGFDLPAKADVMLSPEIHSSEPGRAAELLSDLLARLRSDERVVRVGRSGSEPLEEGAGLLLSGLRVEVELEPRLGPAEAAGDVEAAIRGIAAASGLVPLRIKVWERRGQGLVEELYAIGGATGSLSVAGDEEALAFLRSLEREVPGAATAKLSISALDEGAADLEATLSVRRRRR